MPTPQTIPLLRTKITPPSPRRELLTRHRLITLLDESLEQPVTLVVAGAGFGKSTLVSQWLTNVERRTQNVEQQSTESTDPVLRSTFYALRSAWLSLDPGDNDSVRFWRYVLAAVERAMPEVSRDASSLLHGPEPGVTDAVVAELLNDLDCAAQTLVLILDDYHVIEQSEIHHSLAYAIDHLPAHVHVVILSRADPPLPLNRWRARGQLGEIRADQLRFTPAEAQDYLGGPMALNLAPEQTAILDTRTEGWAAGLHLAALSLRGQRDPAAFITQFAASHRTALDYLFEEVIAQQPVEVQRFLLRTAILDRMCAELCDAVRDEGRRTKDEGSDSDAGAFVLRPSSFVLEEIERQNLFLIRLDAEGAWYRYHHLFRAALRQRLQRQEAARLPLLHRRAADWLVAAGLETEAIDHMLAAGDYIRAADLIETTALSTWLQGEITTLQQRLDTLPAEIKATRPALLLWRAWGALMHGDWPEFERIVAQARLGLEAHEPPDSPRWGELLAQQSLLARMAGKAAESYDLSVQALARLRPDDSFWRSYVSNYVIQAAWSNGDYQAAKAYATESIVHADRIANSSLSAFARAAYAWVLIEEGQVGQAAAYCAQALALSAARGLAQLPMNAYCHNGLAEIALLRNDLAAAQQHIEASLALLATGVLRDALVQTLHMQLSVAWARGDQEELEALFAQMEREMHVTGLPNRDLRWRAQRAWLMLLEGRASEAAVLLEGALQETPSGTSTEGALRMACALLHVDQGRPNEALELLRPGVQVAHLHGVAATLLIAPVRALALDALGQAEEADRILSDALAQAAPEGLVRPFLDLDPRLTPLLEAQSAKRKADDPLHHFCDELLGAIAAPDRVTRWQGDKVKTHATELVTPSPRHPVTPSLQEPLSAREIEVLTQLAEGATNLEIAERLIITERTAKKHVTNILGKLGVANRTQAVRRARELGLVP